MPYIAALCRQYGFERLSRKRPAARDDFDPDRSDVDLLVRFEAQAVQRYAGGGFRYSYSLALEELRKALERLLGRHIDLIPEGSIRNP